MKLGKPSSIIHSVGQLRGSLPATSWRITRKPGSSSPLRVPWSSIYIVYPLSQGRNQSRPDKNRLRELIRSISPETRYWSALDLEFRRFLVDLADDIVVDEDGDSIYGEQVASRWCRTVGGEARKAFSEVARELGDTLRVLKAVALVQDRFHAHLRRSLYGSMR